MSFSSSQRQPTDEVFKESAGLCVSIDLLLDSTVASSHTQVPSIPHKNGVQNLLQICDQGIEQLQQDIQTKQTSLSQLSRRRVALASLVSVFARLPKEIFVMILNEAANGPYFGYPPDGKELVLYSHVCTYWRVIVNGTPRLWNRLHISCGHSESSINCVSHREVLGSILSRSHSLSLTLTMMVGDKVPTDLLRVLGQAQHRIESLALYLSSFHLLEYLPPSSGFTSLANLKISPRNFYYNPKGMCITLNKPLDFSQVGTLRNVKLKILQISRCQMPWASLTAVSLYTEENPTILRDIIVQCSKAEELHVRMLTPWREDEMDGLGWAEPSGYYDVWLEPEEIDEPVVLPSLRTFTVCFEILADSPPHGPCIFSSAPLFQPLTLPSLEEFEMYGPDSCADVYAWSHDATKEFARRSFSSLKTLTITQIVVECDELLEILALCPLVTSFKSTGMRLDMNTFCKALIPSSSPTMPLLPRLEVLDIDAYPDAYNSCQLERSFICLMQERWCQAPRNSSDHSAARLKTVHLVNMTAEIDGSNHVSSQVRSKLTQYAREGLEVEFNGW